MKSVTAVTKWGADEEGPETSPQEYQDEFPDAEFGGSDEGGEE